MYKNILLAYDGSTFSTGVLEQGAELASLCNAELHLLTIIVTGRSMAIAEALGPNDVWGLEEHELRPRVDAAVDRLRSRGLRVTPSMRLGEPAAEIIAYAQEVEADLVVLGHTDKGALTRWLQASVGASLLAHLPCNLLVVAGGKH